MKIRSYLALLALVTSPVFAASQVQSPVNAPATIAPGNIYKAGPNPQQAVDGGTPGNLVPLNAGKSVNNPGTGSLEALMPVQTVTGASKTFATTDCQLETRRSNSGAAMTDTFPAASNNCMANGTIIIVANVDATATDTITAGSGTTFISGSSTSATDLVTAGRAIRYAYDKPNLGWRRTLNTGTALLGPNNLSDLSNPSAARGNLLDTTLHVTPLDAAFAAAGNAQAYNAPTVISAASNVLGIQAAYAFSAGVSVACTSGSNVVVVTVPTGVLMPSYLNTRLGMTGCGAAGGATNNQITALTGSSPTYTLALDANMATTATATSFTVSTNGGNAPPGTSTYQHNMNLTQCAVAVGNVSLVCPGNSFSTVMDMTETGEMGEWFGYVAIHDPTGGCPDFKSKILSSTSTTATLASAPTCAISNSAYVQLYTGQLVLDASMVGYSFDIPNAGVTTGGVTADWKPTLSSVTDPFHGVMSSNASTAWQNNLDRIIAGTDDSTALKAMATYANANGIAQAYFPYGRDYYFANPDMTNLATLQLCADGVRGGHIYYPQDQKILRNVARCMNARNVPPAVRTLNPKLNFRQAMAQPSAVTVDIVGDSMIVPGSNGLGEYGSLSRLVADQIQAANPSKTILINDRAIGATNMCILDPAGPNCSGNGSGIPATAQIGTSVAWYTNGSAQWMSYVLADCPDVIVLRFSNDGSNFLWSSFWNVIAYTQTPTWNSTCGSNPDILFVTPGTQAVDGTLGTNAYAAQESILFIGQFIRSAILAGDTPAMANGGRVGLIDAGQRDWLYNTGVDLENQPMRRANEMAFLHANPNTNIKPTWPITWVSPVLKWGASGMVFGQSVNETAASFWASVGQMNLPLGNGASATPVAAGGQTSTFTTGYPGNQLTVERDSGTGNFTVTGYTYYVPSIGASCSITSGAASLVCTASVANLGYRYGNIAVAGAGAATCPLSIGGSNCLITTLSNVSTDGKTLTLGANASATLTGASTKMVFYHTFYGPKVTGFSTSTYWNQGGVSTYTSNFETQGSRAYLRINSVGDGPSVFAGPIAAFGGHYLPKLTMTNTYSNQWYFFQTTNITQVSSQSEDDGTWPLGAVQTTDLEEWGNYTPSAYTGPYAGGGNAHVGTLGILAYQDVLLANRDGLNFEATSSQAGNTVVAAAAGSFTMPVGATWLNLTPAGTIASFTVTAPLKPAPNSPIVISTTQTITTLTILNNSGQTLTFTPGTLSAGSAVTFRWDAKNATWQRVQ
jgi:hypothetical protein